MAQPWPFTDVPNTATLTTIQVLDGRLPVCLVTHDADDGTWQFLCGTTNDPADGRVVALHRLLELDPELAEVADLPVGWHAWRDRPGAPWHRVPKLEEGDK